MYMYIYVFIFVCIRPKCGWDSEWPRAAGGANAAKAAPIANAASAAAAPATAAAAAFGHSVWFRGGWEGHWQPLNPLADPPTSGFAENFSMGRVVARGPLEGMVYGSAFVTWTYT